MTLDLHHALVDLVTLSHIRDSSLAGVFHHGDLVVLVALGIVGWTLWLRRLAWRWRQRREQSGIAIVALMGLALMLVSPVGAGTLGRGLYALTGKSQLHSFLAQCCALVGAALIALHMLRHLGDDDAVALRRFRRILSVVIPVLLGTIVLSPMTSGRFYPSLFDLPPDGWIDVNEVVFGATMVYLLAHAIGALLVLRRDPRSRNLASLYIAAITCGITAGLIRIATAVAPEAIEFAAASVVRILVCLFVALFALVAAASWQAKLAPFQNLRRAIRRN